MRAATVADIERALTVLVALKVTNPNKQMQWAEPEPALEYMMRAAANGGVVIVDGYLIMFSVGPPWFSKQDFLIEELILKIEPTPAKVEVAIAALDQLRAMFNCVAIIAGDTQIGYMAPKYLAAGYQPLGLQLIKE